MEEGVTMAQITLTEALAKVKRIEKQLNKLLYNEHVNVVDIIVDGKLRLSRETEDAFVNQVKSFLDKTQALIAQREALKAAIATANASTKVVIAGREYTIAGAIERKNNLNYEKDLAKLIKSQIDDALERVEDINDHVDEEITDIVKSRMESGVKDAKVDELIKSLKEIKEAKLFDPLNLRTTIIQYMDNIEQFEAEVDVVLSVANARTVIEFGPPTEQQSQSTKAEQTDDQN